MLGVVVLLATALALAAPRADAGLSAKFFGVSAVTPGASDFELMGRGGVGTYRLLLTWRGVQSDRNGAYDWSAPDSEIGAALENGMEVLPFLYGTPSFAGAKVETPPLGSAVARQGWQRFVAAAVRRYGPKGELWDQYPGLPYRPVREWQLWNEQNASHFWKQKPSPRKYAKLLKLSTPVIRSVDSKADVVLGGMFGFPNGKRSVHMRTYLKRLYQVRGVRRLFDAVALHPYGGTLRLMNYQVSRAREIMDRAGDSRTAIWITELGWATDGPREWPLVTSKRGQAKLLRQSFERLVDRRRKYRIKRVIWFVWRDFEHPDCEWCGSAGLVDGDHAPKPAWAQFKRFAKRAG